MRRIKRAWQWAKTIDLFLLLALLVVIGGTWAFIRLLDEVHEGDTQRVDEWIYLSIAGAKTPGWVREVGRDITALGGVAVLTLVTSCVASYLFLEKKHHALILLIIATVGALLLSTLLKWLIDRPRPDLLEPLSYVVTTSFPSGHSMLSATVYLTLGTLLARLSKRWLLRCYIVGIAVLLTGLVGISRVFMRVHWPTDVLAGWTAGLVWAIFCWAVARYLQQRGSVEQPE